MYVCGFYFTAWFPRWREAEHRQLVSTALTARYSYLFSSILLSFLFDQLSQFKTAIRVWFYLTIVAPPMCHPLNIPCNFLIFSSTGKCLSYHYFLRFFIIHTWRMRSLGSHRICLVALMIVIKVKFLFVVLTCFYTPPCTRQQNNGATCPPPSSPFQRLLHLNPLLKIIISTRCHQICIVFFELPIHSLM